MPHSGQSVVSNIPKSPAHFDIFFSKADLAELACTCLTGTICSQLEVNYSSACCTFLTRVCSQSSSMTSLVNVLSNG